MIHRGWWVLLAVLAVLSLLLRHDVLFLSAVLLALASGTSVLWFRYCLSGVTYRRRLGDERIFCGQQTEIALIVTNAKPLPLAWLLIRDGFPEGVSLVTGPSEAAEP